MMLVLRVCMVAHWQLIMTRPSVKLDREKFLSFFVVWACESKFVVGAILYDPPSFERAMLLRSGIPIVQWKKADLVLAKRCGRTGVIEGPTLQSVPMKPITRIELRNIVVDIVMDRFDDHKDRSVRVPQGGYWMKTPSREEKGLDECNVFVSNGARFISDRPLDLAARLESIRGYPVEKLRLQLAMLGFPDDAFAAKLRAL